MSTNSEFEENTQVSKFQASYTCFPLVNKDKLKVERGGKLLLPVSALEQIETLDLPFPLIFKVQNDNNDHCTHAGVFEFTAEEGTINVPEWMLKYLNLKAGGTVTVESVSLPSATFCRLEPLTRNFAYISDTKAVLEENLKYFACLTEGDVLFVHEPNKNQAYKVKIVETKPASAVCILDCEMELELYVPEKPKRTARGKNSQNESNTSPGVKNILKTFVAFKGTGYSLKNGKRKLEEKDKFEPPVKRSRLEENQATMPNELVFLRERQKEFVRQQNEKFVPFQGKGYSLKD